MNKQKNMMYSEEKLLEILKDAKELVNGKLSRRKFDKLDKHFPHSDTFNHRFGSWNEAKRKAGIEVEHRTNRPKQVKECTNCGQEFERYVSELRKIKGNKIFCSNSCQYEYMVGQKHDLWEEGVDSGKYRKTWYTQRKKALERDNYSCQKCGRCKDEVDHCLDVHHIEPLRTFEDLDKAHRLENLKTLCRSCHVEVENSE